MPVANEDLTVLAAYVMAETCHKEVMIMSLFSDTDLVQ